MVAGLAEPAPAEAAEAAAAAAAGPRRHAAAVEEAGGEHAAAGDADSLPSSGPQGSGRAPLLAIEANNEELKFCGELLKDTERFGRCLQSAQVDMI